MRLDQGGVGDVWLGYRPEGVVLRAWRFAVIPDESELVDLYGFAVGDLAGFGPGGLGAFADGDHEGYQVGVGEVDDFGDGLEIKSVHGDAVVAFGFGGEHEGGAGEAAGAHTLVSLDSLVAFVVLLNGGDNDVLDFLGGVFPITLGVLFPGRFVGAEYHQQGGIGYRFLVPSDGTDLFADLRVLYHDKTPVLDVEGRWGLHREIQDFPDFGIRHLV